MVKTDVRRIQQVILNLLTNAVKFTEREGEIKVMVDLITTETRKTSLRISVTDNGLGIKEENQSKLFRMFGTFKDTSKNVNVQGIGLGLFICKLIVQKFNGMIDFVSKEGEGTTFFFTFEVEPNRNHVFELNRDILSRVDSGMSINELDDEMIEPETTKTEILNNKILSF